MSQFSEDAKDFARFLRYAADCISFTQDVNSYHSCNDCGGRLERRCPYIPESGKLARINCPLWYEEKK